MTDFHTHILPGMDDGSRSAEESLTMLQMAAAQGVERVAVTPHFDAERESPDEFLLRRDRAEALLQEATAGRRALPQVCAGAEVRYFEGFSSAESISRLKIQGTDLLLLEMPFVPWTERMFREIRQAQASLSCTILLAHIERYLRYQEGRKFWERLEETGALIQANAEFFLSRSGRRKALRMLESGRIHLLGSDCHHSIKRPPNMADAINVISSRLGSEPLRRMEGLERQLMK